MSDKRKSSNYHTGKKQRSCYFCECGPPLEEHHVIPQRFAGPDKPENIVELCQLCHRRLERLYDKSFYEWFGISDEQGQRIFHRPCSHGDCNNTADVKMEIPRPVRPHRFQAPKDLLCFSHANIYYNKKRIIYIFSSEIHHKNLITRKGWKMLEERYGEPIENPEEFTTTIEDAKAIGFDNFTPLDKDGNELTRFEIMNEYVTDRNDRVSEYFPN